MSSDFRSGFIAVVGRPNVGKSTLLNHLLGQKIAIVSSKPQTTRDRILGVLTEEDAQYLFLDTPGIHKPKNRLDRYMLQLAQETISGDADLVLWVVDGSRSPTREDRLIGEMLQQLHEERPLPEVVIGLNQSDRWSPNEAALESRQREYAGLLDWLADEDPDAAVATVSFSALSGDGTEELLEVLRDGLPEGPPYYPEDTVTDLPMRIIAAEIVREKALELLRQEVPHSIAVAVTDWEERENGILFIGATVYVERQSQKGIVLGHKGSTIKAIGQAARPEIEEMVDSKVYLELWVKVWEKWRRRQNMLYRLGYSF